MKPAQLNKKRESVINTAATMRVLNVLKHWVSKHTQDFECDPQLKAAVKDLLEEMVSERKGNDVEELCRGRDEKSAVKNRL